MVAKLSAIVLLIFIIFISYSFIAPAEEKQEAEKQTILESARSMSQEGKAEILKRSCSTSGCHRGEYPKAKLNLEPEKMHAATVNVPSKQIETLKLVDTSDPEASYLLMKIRGIEGIKKNRMPINAPPLTENDIKTVRLWIHVLHIINTK
jgi:hypothetical protein